MFLFHKKCLTPVVFLQAGKWWLGCLGFLVVRWSEILSIQLMNDEKDVFQTLMGKTCFKCCVRWQRPLSTWTSQGQNGHKMFSKDSSGTDKWKTNWLDHMLVFVLFGGKDLCNQIVARFQRRRTVWVWNMHSFQGINIDQEGVKSMRSIWYQRLSKPNGVHQDLAGRINVWLRVLWWNWNA